VGSSVKCMDGLSRLQFSVSLCIDESMKKDKSVAPAGEAETSIDGLLDLLDLELSGKAPPTMVCGRGKELLVDAGTIFFLEVQNRDPKMAGHVMIKMNDDVQGIWRLRPNEKLNIRHPALSNEMDMGKWVVEEEMTAVDMDKEAGKTINHLNRISRSGKVQGKGGTVEIRFEPENNMANTRNQQRNKRYPVTGEEFTTASGKINVMAVQSSTYRMAVQPPADKSAAGVGDEELQKAMQAQAQLTGESARITQSGAKFSKLLYTPVTTALNIDTKEVTKSTVAFSFQIGDASSASNKRAKTE